MTASLTPPLQLRPPQPAVYLFILDVSHNAVETGYLSVFCQSLLDNINAYVPPSAPPLSWRRAPCFFKCASSASPGCPGTRGRRSASSPSTAPSTSTTSRRVSLSLRCSSCPTSTVSRPPTGTLQFKKCEICFTAPQIAAINFFK